MQVTFESLAALRKAVFQAFANPGDRYAPEVVIAGGAVRDLLLGRPVKDIDIFIGNLDDWFEECDQEADWNTVAESIFEHWHNGASTSSWNKREAAPVIRTEMNLKPVEGSKYAESFLSVVTTIPGFTEIQLIGTRDPVVDHILHRFDFTICEAWLDESGRPKVSPAFRHDAAHKILRFKGEDGLSGRAVTRSVDHADRLAQKFPGWRRVGWRPIESVRQLHKDLQETIVGKREEIKKAVPELFAGQPEDKKNSTPEYYRSEKYSTSYRYFPNSKIFEYKVDGGRWVLDYPDLALKAIRANPDRYKRVARLPD